jgi:hypothetical protein
MTIFLPQESSQFRTAFDEICNRILQSDQDTIFYALIVQLITKLRENPTIREFILQAEIESSKRQNEFSEASLKVHEYNWKKLWQYHRHSYRHCKDLARIKREITNLRTILSSTLHNRIGSAMWEFRCRSPFFSFLNIAPVLFRKAQFDMQFWTTLTQHFSSSKEEVVVHRKIRPLKFKMRDKAHKLTFRAFKLLKTKCNRSFIWHSEQISTLFSPLMGDLESKFLLPGQNSDEKRRNMLFIAETDFTYCWERLRFLEQCYLKPSGSNSKKPFLGKWEAVRDIAWHAAWERCEEEVLYWAKMSFQQKLSLTSISCDRQIHRKDFETYIKAMQRHIHTQLFIIESSQHKAKENFLLANAGTQRSCFVIELARSYWKNHPQASYDEVYSYYLDKCHPEKWLVRTSWERIVRKHKLDPRSRSQKKRGKGKKALQN